MMLVEEGRVALDDPVHRYIPAVEGSRGVSPRAHGRRGSRRRRPPAPMRIVDLLRHTGGADLRLPEPDQRRRRLPPASRSARSKRPATSITFVAGLATLPLEFAPGTAWNYSVSTDVIGYLDRHHRRRAVRRFPPAACPWSPSAWSIPAFHVRAGQEHRLAACYSAGARWRRPRPPGRSGGPAASLAPAELRLGRRRARLDDGRLREVRAGDADRAEFPAASA